MSTAVEQEKDKHSRHQAITALNAEINRLQQLMHVLQIVGDNCKQIVNNSEVSGLDCKR